ncbi:MAG: putative lipid II flippase FtsW [Oscillospiraceae bacterium]|nr:putative lipid II flippase FtsW [Oscillospiraceae bacterium]
MTRSRAADTKKKTVKKNSIFKVAVMDINDWRIRSKSLGTVDLPFFFIVMILLVMGIIMMFSASYAWAISEGRSGTYYAVKQLMYGGGGLVAMFILSKIDYHFFQNKIISVGIFLVTLVMMILILFEPLNLGVNLNGATRWIAFGRLQFQPSEVMKFAIIIMFSMMISHNYKRMKEFRVGVLPFGIILGVIAILMMLEPHLSGTILICGIGIVLIFVGGCRMVHLLEVGGCGILLLALGVFYKIEKSGFTYFEKRFQSWLDPFSDMASDTWQTAQSLIAIGSGGIFGMGLGESRQKFQYLPETKNDFVFAVVCEELGYVGAVTVIVLFALFVFRGFYIASKAPDKFGMLVCIGLTMQVGLQAFLNIAVVSNLIPNTGISLPFFSYGGTSLMMLLAQMGIILNISRYASSDLKSTKRHDAEPYRKILD